MSAASALFVTSAPMRRPLLRRFFDAAERQRVDIDKMRRGLDLQLHEIDQVGAAGNELGLRVAAADAQADATSLARS